MTMIVTDGYTDLPAGYVAAVATFLEMRAPVAPRPVPHQPDLVLRQQEEPNPALYRDVFRRVGAAWLWNARLRLEDAALLEILSDPAVEIFFPERDGAPVGLLEIDFRIGNEAEIAYFGLMPEELSRGAGRWLMDHALRRAWRPDIGRVWLHNCTLDHPDAMAFYLRSGFKPYERKIEMFPDPRLTGLLPRDAAPHIPIISA
jgi:GNAT superfamily N-acetyltransferase